MPDVLKTALRDPGAIGTLPDQTLGAPRARADGPVLVVDADPAVRRMLALVLASAGWATAEAEDGASGLRQVAAIRPLAVLAEVRLADITSVQFVQAVRGSDAPGACIILMSAYPRPKWAMEDYFLPKPLHFDRLLGILEDVRAAG